MTRTKRDAMALLRDSSRHIRIAVPGIITLLLLVPVALVWAQEQPDAPLAIADSGGSLLVSQRRVAIKKGPSRKYKLRGMAVKGTRLPVLASIRGNDCNAGVWYRVHDDAWVCGDDVTLVRDTPAAVPQPPMDNSTVTPWPYAFIRDTAIEYEWSRNGWLEEIREIYKGFGFGVEKRVTVDGARYYRTPEGKYIATSDAVISGRISTFRGVSLSRADHWPVGWVNSREAWVYSSPSVSAQNRVRQLVRYDFFSVLEEVTQGRKRFYRIGEDAWVLGQHVRVATTAPRPRGVLDDERWVDVDVNQQIATAYVGDVPVYATLVSTGRYGGSKTVTGAFRIWVKVAAIAMDNTDEEEELDTDTGATSTDTAPARERKLYSLQDVPWTQFFHESYAIHAVYWHDRFGNRKSHGCVNMAPADARWFYEWTAPHVPEGWWSVYSTESDRGTMIRVR
ncbi:MAG: L,D-transpeptidase [Deltaproteobacteria bacterium]|nr:L,D-transpeptidase [Deltaproteobacteria bacterium]